MSSSVNAADKNKDIFIQKGLDATILTAEAKNPINFIQPTKRFVLSLHYNGSNSVLFVNATKIYHFKAKNSEIKDYTLCLSNVSNILQLMMWKKKEKEKNRIKRNCNFFSIDFNSSDTNDILDIIKYLMKNIV